MTETTPELDQKILAAAKNRDFEEVDRLLKTVENTELDEQLLNAAMNNRSEESEELLDQGANPNAKNEFGTTVLMFAAGIGPTHLVQKLIHLGADVNAQNNIRIGVLKSAVERGRIETVKLLIQAGADVNQIGCADYTALLSAAKNGHTAIVRLLLENGADIHLPQNERIVLETASNGHIQVLEVLMNAGMDIHKPDYRGWTPLICAAEHDYVETVQFLLQQGADVNAICDGDWNAILRCAGHGSVEMLALLLEAGADVNAQSSQGSTLLMRVLNDDDADIALQKTKLLISKGVDVTTTTSYGTYALSLAAGTENTSIAEALIVADTDILTKTERIQTARDRAIECQKPNMVAFLQDALDHPEKYDSLARGILQGQIEKMSPQDILQMPSQNPELLQKICLVGALFQVAFDKLSYEKQKLFYAQTYKAIDSKTRLIMEKQLRNKANAKG